MACAPVETTSLYDINLILAKMCFIGNVVEKHYTHHNPKLKQQCLWLVEFTAAMENFKPTNLTIV